jgi:hypothetical protein
VGTLTYEDYQKSVNQICLIFNKYYEFYKNTTHSEEQDYMIFNYNIDKIMKFQFESEVEKQSKLNKEEWHFIKTTIECNKIILDFDSDDMIKLLNKIKKQERLLEKNK